MNNFVRWAIYALSVWITYNVTYALTEKDENKKRNGFLAAGPMVLLLMVVDFFQRNTVNYTLYNKGKRVYDGITKVSRRGIRMAEHRVSGKKFDRVRFSPEPTYRSSALELEEMRIRQYKPMYNIQHNS